jgi:peptidoglycan hydrolase-like protein with peptidoglycan-binding domain
VRGRSTSIIAVAALALAAPATAHAIGHRAPQLTRIRCVPATTATCRTGIKVTIGRQIQISGRRVYKGMRVSFRWPKGAIATKLDHTHAGYIVRVPPGTSTGMVSVTLSDRAGRRSNVKRISVTPVPQVGSPTPARGALPAAFTGNGMWIWELPETDGGDLAAIVAQAHAAGLSTLFIKSSDGAVNRWAQFNPQLVATLHANGLRVCAWQYVYGSDPLGEAAQGASAVSDGADCLVIDAEVEYEGRYAAAQQYISALRTAVGPAYPIGLTSFPYVDYHPKLPYSVFLGPGGAQVNLPQVYWKSIGGTVDAVSAHTLAHNRIYGNAIAPLGQSYTDTPPDDIARFRAIWSAYGSGGLSWWSWQSTGADQWTAVGAPFSPLVLPPPDPGWPALEKGNKGDEVVWLQEHLVSFDPAVSVTASFDTATDTALRNLQTARGLEVTGVTDPLTWKAVLGLPLVPVDWTSQG